MIPMLSPSTYTLLDFGAGRRLERFGEVVVDRPCPTAERMPQADPAVWRQAQARFERTDDERGEWTVQGELREPWTIGCGAFTLELRRTEFGQVGLFPEQTENWDWIARQVRASVAAEPTERPRVLNLFAYTGGSTLAAAAAGAEVVHVDAARNIVAWARRNAELSGLAAAPIRWIVDDAVKFVKRELRRGSHYDAAILDPPSYGHGAHGEVWRLSKHLPRLLALSAELTAERRRFMLLSCHTPGYTPERLGKMMAEVDLATVDARELAIATAAGRSLPSGAMARWEQM